MAKTTKPAGEKKAGTRKAKSAADLKAQLEKAKAAIAVLEQRAYAGELDELIKKSNIVSAFNVVKANVKGATDLAILAAIAKAVGIKRVEITQKAPVPRKPKAK